MLAIKWGNGERTRAGIFLLSKGHHVGERIDAGVVQDYLVEYTELHTAHLQRMCNEYHKIANDALNTKLPEPFVIPKKT